MDSSTQVAHKPSRDSIDTLIETLLQQSKAPKDNPLDMPDTTPRVTAGTDDTQLDSKMIQTNPPDMIDGDSSAMTETDNATLSDGETQVAEDDPGAPVWSPEVVKDIYEYIDELANEALTLIKSMLDEHKQQVNHILNTSGSVPDSCKEEIEDILRGYHAKINRSHGVSWRSPTHITKTSKKDAWISGNQLYIIATTFTMFRICLRSFSVVLYIQLIIQLFGSVTCLVTKRMTYFEPCGTSLMLMKAK
jgi:hypothetical protein